MNLKKLLTILFLALHFSHAAAQTLIETQQQLHQAKQFHLSNNHAAAFPIYLPLAQQNITEAQFNLRVSYANGQSVRQDLRQAKHYFGLA